MNLKTEINKKFKLYGNIVFILALLITFAGWIAIYSTTVCKASSTFLFLKKQIIATILSIFLCGVVANTNYRIVIKKVTYPLAILTFLLLIVVLFTKEVKGAHRWIQIPFFGNFQPSELAKFTTVLIIAKFLDEYRSKVINGKKEFWIMNGIIFIFCILILLQPDIGIPSIIFSVSIILFFLYSIKTQHILKTFLIILVLLSVGIITQPYRIKRIFSFINKDKQDSTSYQIEQSLLALSRGGMLGCGIGRGIFKESYVPEIHTDFIFCTIGEEAGFIGCIITISLYFFLFLFCLLIAQNTKDFYGSVLVVGLALNIIIQAYLSIAVATKLFLPKGIGLPFISYGGSSLIINFLSIGCILSVWRKNFYR